MVAPEFIVFASLFTIPIIWTLLKVLVNHLLDSDPPPPTLEREEIIEQSRKVA
jgi:hypothetical protein